jgi:hypothetical protein
LGRQATPRKPQTIFKSFRSLGFRVSGLEEEHQIVQNQKSTQTTTRVKLIWQAFDIDCVLTISCSDPILATTGRLVGWCFLFEIVLESI